MSSLVYIVSKPNVCKTGSLKVHKNEGAPELLQHTLSMRLSGFRAHSVSAKVLANIFGCLYHNECAPQPLNRILSARRSCWIGHWGCAGAAESVTEGAPQPLKRSLRLRCSHFSAHCGFAKACTYMHDHVRTWPLTFMTMYVHEYVRLWPCPQMTIYNCACTFVHVRSCTRSCA